MSIWICRSAGENDVVHSTNERMYCEYGLAFGFFDSFELISDVALLAVPHTLAFTNRVSALLEDEVLFGTTYTAKSPSRQETEWCGRNRL